MKQRGIFISFEGSEGCGKSTQIQRLAATLESRKVSFLLAREPGTTAIGEKIRHLLKHTDIPLAPETELFLFAASRAQLVTEILAPALLAGSCIICDRFADSTAVYQGTARGISADFIEQVNQYATKTCVPDITFLLDMDATSALKRAHQRENILRDRLEQEPGEFYEAVRRGYLQRAKKEPTRFVILNAEETSDSLAQIIIKTLEVRWPFLSKMPCSA